MAFSSTIRPGANNLFGVIRAIFAFLLVFFSCAAARAESFLFRGATIVTVSGETVEGGDLLVREGKIEQVGKDLSADGATVIDVSGRHIYPGLIAAGTSAGLVEIDMVRATVDAREVGEFTPDVRSWVAVNPDSELLPVARANGITHIVPVPAGGVVSGLSGLVALDGWTVKDMAVKTPAALHLFWPSMGLDMTPKEALRDRSRYKSLEDQAKERAARLQEIDDFFLEAEVYARGGKKEQDQYTPAWEAMVPFADGEIPLMVHADEYRQIKAAVEWAEKRNHKIIIAGGRDAWMLADLLAEHDVPVLFERVFYQGSGMAPTPARDVDAYDVHYRAPSVLHKAGVQLAIGLGIGGHPASDLRNLSHAAAQAAAFGLPRSEAIKAITLAPAEISGVGDRLGSIEPGKEATFIVMNGDLLDIRSSVLEVWIAGRKTSLETRHTRLYEKYKNRPRPQP